jgi:hypothetical protein
MKKIISLGVTLAILMSFSACKARDNGMESANSGINNDTRNQLEQAGMQGTNNIDQGETNLKGVSDSNYNAGNYQDGIYTGFGDTYREEVERAIVTIKNGRIADIHFTTIDQQQSTNTQNPEYSDSHGIYIGTNNGNGAGSSPIVDTNNTTGAGANNVDGTGTGANTGAGTNNTTDMGTGIDAGNTIRDAINGVKTSLVDAMIKNQNVNAYINVNNTYVGRRIANCRLAVARALEQARR